jgi:hypothetical protein
MKQKIKTQKNFVIDVYALETCGRNNSCFICFWMLFGCNEKFTSSLWYSFPTILQTSIIMKTKIRQTPIWRHSAVYQITNPHSCTKQGKPEKLLQIRRDWEDNQIQYITLDWILKQAEINRNFHESQKKSSWFNWQFCSRVNFLV